MGMGCVQVLTGATRKSHKLDKQLNTPRPQHISSLYDEGDTCGQLYTYSAQLLPPDNLLTSALACVHLTGP